MKNSRTVGLKKSLLSVFLGLGVALTASQAHAQAYPNKPIKAIVPFAAGSATDQIGRAFAQKMSEVLGQTIVVENKAGVNGMLGADAPLRRPCGRRGRLLRRSRGLRGRS